jgi:hypothetical protein
LENQKYVQFDLEQQIMQCWNIVDELKLLNELILEKDLSKDDISNIILGLETLYQHKFDKCFQLFEELLKETKNKMKSLKVEHLDNMLTPDDDTKKTSKENETWQFQVDPKDIVAGISSIRTQVP